MRIGDINPPAQSAEAGRAGSEKTAGAAHGRSPVQSDTDGVALSCLWEAIASGGGNDVRIEELRLRVQSGAYQVSASELAKKIVDFHTE